MKYNSHKNESDKAYQAYLSKTVGKDPYPAKDKILCDPYSTKYMPKGGNCDPLKVKKYVDSSKV